jgi:hypothetical protein
MPFTFSHPAIVLPFVKASKHWFSTTALVIGSMAPDFEYFIRMRVKSIYSHTFFGLLWFDLPLTLILAFIFHLIVRNILISNLPNFLRSRLSVFTNFDWNAYFKSHYIVVIISALIGAFSHIAWDSFTHEDGFAVERIAYLSSVIQIGDKELAVFKILQHGSSLIGALVIAWTIYRLPKHESKVITSPTAKYWAIVVAICLAVFRANLKMGLDPTMFGHLIVVIISGTLIGLILTSAYFNVPRSNRKAS